MLVVLLLVCGLWGVAAQQQLWSRIACPKVLRFGLIDHSAKSGEHSRVLSIYFHNSFGQYEYSTCMDFDGSPQLCDEHPRCTTAPPPAAAAGWPESGQPRRVSQCVLHPLYLQYIAASGNCDEGSTTVGERLAVIKDLLREKKLLAHSSPIPEDGTQGAKVATCGAIRAAVQAVSAAAELVAKYKNHGLNDKFPLPTTRQADQLAMPSALSVGFPPQQRGQGRLSFFDRWLSNLNLKRPMASSQLEPHPLAVAPHGEQFIAPSELSLVRPSRGQRAVRIGINGFGDIGRLVFFEALRRPDLVIKHINSPLMVPQILELLKSSQSYGNKPAGSNSSAAAPVESVAFERDALLVRFSEGHSFLRIPFTTLPDATAAPWAAMGVEYVVESTAQYCSTEACLRQISNRLRGNALGEPLGAAAVRQLAATGPTAAEGVGEVNQQPNFRMEICRSCWGAGTAKHVAVTSGPRRMGVEEKLLVSTIHRTTTDTPRKAAAGSKDSRRQEEFVLSGIVPPEKLDVTVLSASCVLESSAVMESLSAAVGRVAPHVQRIVSIRRSDTAETKTVADWPRCRELFDNGGLPGGAGGIGSLGQQPAERRFPRRRGEEALSYVDIAEWAHVNELLFEVVVAAGGATAK